MQYYHPLSDHKAVERAADAFSSSRSKLEEPTSHRPTVRHTKCWAELNEKFDEPRIVGENIDRPRFNLVKD
jgi:hypothetical protein